MSTLTAERSGRRPPRSILPWLATPALLLFAGFAVVPLVGVFALSFTTWDGIGSIRPTGLTSWRAVLTDPGLPHALWVTFLVMAVSWAVQTPLSILLGTFLAGRQRYRAVLGVVYFVPLMLSSAAIAIAYKALLDPNFGMGAGLNVEALSQDWLGRPGLAFGVVVFVVSWQFVPFHSLIYQGGVQQIPQVALRSGRAGRRRTRQAVLQHHAAPAEVHDHHLVHPDGRRVTDLLRPHLRPDRGRPRRRHPGPRTGHVQAGLPGQPHGTRQRSRGHPGPRGPRPRPAAAPPRRRDAGAGPHPGGDADRQLDPDRTPVAGRRLARGGPADPEALRGRVDLDSPGNRALARTLAEEAVVLLANDGTLPLDRPRRIALIGPNADEPTAVLGCYSFPQHIGVQHPGTPLGIALPTLRETLATEFPDAAVTYVRGTGVDDGDLTGLDEAVRAAREADVTVAVLGDRAGLFGRGTSGEGCDAETLELPGAQQQLLDALLDSGTPVVTVLLAGRPYALGRAVTESAAIVQSFFPGEEGTHAIAGVLSGRVNPSGRLPVGVPRTPGLQPGTYLGARLAHAGDASAVDPAPAFPFGHGLSYTRFDWTDLTADTQEAPTDGEFILALTVRNTGDRPGTEVVQLYLHDPVASVVQPLQRLVGYTRVALEPGESRRLTVTVPADLASFTGRDGRRIVEPGELELRLAASSTDRRLTARVTLTGTERHVDHTRRLHATFTQKPAT
ncbi:hypothetical protein SALBM217S_06778 [Streptomyces griseoloalbus]